MTPCAGGCGKPTTSGSLPWRRRCAGGSASTRSIDETQDRSVVLAEDRGDRELEERLAAKAGDPWDADLRELVVEAKEKGFADAASG